MAHPHAHSKHHRRPARSARLAVLVVAAVALAGTVVALVSRTADATQATATTTTMTTPRVAPVPFGVAAISPTDGSTDVTSDAVLTVRFTRPLAPGSPMPTLSPATPGNWEQLTPTTVAFVASQPWIPASKVDIAIPDGPQGVTGRLGGTLTQPVTAHFTVAAGSTLRLQQLLAQLGYLPVSFAATAPLASPQEAAQPQEGSFAWRWAEPASLVSLWTPGSPNTITKGAVMAFEARHHLRTDGSPGPAVWSALLADAAAGSATSDPYNYVYVSRPVPQKVTIYSNGAPVYTTPANTGIAAAPTDIGTFPVYLRYESQTMTGTNPDGSRYSDPGIPWVSYFSRGDALHGFVRGSYGWPQSVGCVELPPANAKIVYPLTPIGTLVTVS